MKSRFLICLTVFSFILFASCNNNPKANNDKVNTPKAADSAATSAASPTTASVPDNAKKNSVAEIYAKPQIPILCYHRIADGRKDEYSVSPSTFLSHLDALKNNGYHSVSPDQLYNYLVYNQPLPEKPFMITFDDSRIEHFEIAGPELKKRGFTGAFFIMTITYNKKNYMSTEQIAQMAKDGHTIGLHSWDHTMASKYTTPEDWKKQVEDPKKKLEDIIGKKVDYWAYPNGVYNHAAAEGLSKYFKISFILTSKRDSIQPLQTVRRMIIPTMSPERLLKSIEGWK